MSLRLLHAAADAENTDELHLGRLLVLLSSAGGRRQTKTVEGITKLAKLDFLLRYPNCLERALQHVGQNPEKAEIQPYERDTIETKMIRFRYGPWDGRYRRWLSLLVAKGLAEVTTKGRTVHITLTSRGYDTAAVLRQSEHFMDIAKRSDMITQTFGAYSGKRLMNFVYETFPELLNMKWGENIQL